MPTIDESEAKSPGIGRSGSAAFRAAPGRFASGVVVTASAGEERVRFTCGPTKEGHRHRFLFPRGGFRTMDLRTRAALGVEVTEEEFT